ncbi:hypothetical protein Tco_0900265 [Tanacetum coccineum]
MVSAQKDPLTFDELMATPIDFSEFAKNRHKLDKITKANLVGPVYNLLKGTYQSSIELEYNMEECYKALFDQLDWTTPEGDLCPFNLSKPLLLKGRPDEFCLVTNQCFINRLLKYWHVLIATSYTRWLSSSGYVAWLALGCCFLDGLLTAVTAVSVEASAYWILELKAKPDCLDSEGSLALLLVLLFLFSFDILSKAVVGKNDRAESRGFHACNGHLYWLELYAAITLVVSVKVDKLHGYGYLEEIVVTRADRQLYKFKEGDFVNLHLNDIEDMLLLVVQHKLFHLDGDVIVDLAVALRMFTRSLIIKKRVEDVLLGVESYQKKLNITKP